MTNPFSEILALRGTPWYRWHPQIAMRYSPVAERIREEGLAQPKAGAFRRADPISILEIGSGGLGIAPYLRMPVTGVDREFEPPFHPLLKRVKGDATDLKFGDNSFDVVISMDMLEHLPKEKRQKAVLEMMRVGRKTVIIGVPCGREAEEHDRNIFIASLGLSTRPDQKSGLARDDGLVDKGLGFLEEQVEYGLPEEIDILHYIKVAEKRLKKEVNIEVRGNMNINLRKFLMRGWMSRNLIVNIIFRKVFLVLIPVFRMMDREPYYRKIFFVEIKRDPNIRIYPNDPNS